MRTRLALITVLGAVALFLTPVAAQASTTSTDGPYAYSDTDNGQCGNAWATETGNRYFSKGGSNTTNTITETYKSVHWSTFAGLAPGDLQPNEDGTCDPATADTVAEGVTGNMHGTETIVVTGSPYVPGDGSCAGPGKPCTTDGYIAYHYPGATYTVTAYKFTYKEGDSGTLTTAVSNDQAWVENCPTQCANNGYDEQNYSRGNIATSE
jgi:hypothetical protein